jgi:Phenylalanine-4-hydroxylase
VEFGLCKQDGQLRVYGAGLLSSVAELRHALTAAEKTKRFDPEITCKEECIITAFQNAYYYTDSFEEAKEKMRQVNLHVCALMKIWHSDLRSVSCNKII